MVPQGRSSDILEQLYGDIKPYQKILKIYQKKLAKSYPNKHLNEFFSLIDKKIISIAPMVFCSSLLSDLGYKVEKEDLAALGLHMLAISTHDDVVDEMPKDRIQLAALVYAGNIATNEGSRLLIKRNKTRAADILLNFVNQNHFYQQHVIETLWQKAPSSYKEYQNGVNHIRIFIAIGLLYGLELFGRMDLKKKITSYASNYGLSLQLIDDLREVEEDKINGYYSFPLTEGEPYKKSLNHLSICIKSAKKSIPKSFIRLHDLVDRLEKFANSIKN